MAVGTLEKKVTKKVIFSLMARPLREELLLRLSLFTNEMLTYSGLVLDQQKS